MISAAIEYALPDPERAFGQALDLQATHLPPSQALSEKHPCFEDLDCSSLNPAEEVFRLDCSSVDLERFSLDWSFRSPLVYYSVPYLSPLLMK
jgi:hypothetical protein